MKVRRTLIRFRVLCRVIKVDRSRYYAYQRDTTYPESTVKAACAERVKECFGSHRRRYGSRRIAAALQIGRFTVRKVMKREGLRAIAPKRFTPQTTDFRHDLPVCPNLLQTQANAPTAKGAVLVGDITYLRLRNGKYGKFCNLAVLQYKFTRRIVGWKVSERMTAQFVIDVFLQARRRGLIGKNAIIHTYQGSQYAAVKYSRLLYVGGLRQSMSCKGNCYYNALKRRVSSPVSIRN